jgi:cytoskeletal protein CcmA (bactofilin family)
MAKPFTPSVRPAHGSNFSMLGADTNITGDIRASADLHVDGSVEGDIACNALVQGEGSEITGSVRAESVRIAGIVRGSVHAREVVILRTARIEGDVAYDALTIEQGARLEGRLSPNGGQKPPQLAQLPSSTRHEATLITQPAE